MVEPLHEIKTELDDLEVESFRSELSVLLKKMEQIEENRVLE